VSVRLYADVHVPRGVIEGLRLRGIGILTAQEDGAAELLDPELLTRATERGGCSLRCQHLANANKFDRIRRVNTMLGLSVPSLVTPLELLGSDDAEERG
jgi:hypothetical protein